jgi:hypothetical protein
VDAQPPPALRIIRGTPTDEELAALIAVLVIGARRAGARNQDDRGAPRSRWRASALPATGWPVGPRAWSGTGRA